MPADNASLVRQFAARMALGSDCVSAANKAIVSPLTVVYSNHPAGTSPQTGKSADPSPSVSDVRGLESGMTVAFGSICANTSGVAPKGRSIWEPLATAVAWTFVMTRRPCCGRWACSASNCVITRAIMTVANTPAVRARLICQPSSHLLRFMCLPNRCLATYGLAVTRSN